MRSERRQPRRRASKQPNGAWTFWTHPVPWVSHCCGAAYLLRGHKTILSNSWRIDDATASDARTPNALPCSRFRRWSGAAEEFWARAAVAQPRCRGGRCCGWPAGRAAAASAAVGLTQQECTRALRVWGDFGSILLPWRTTQRNAAWIWGPGSRTGRTGRDDGTPCPCRPATSARPPSVPARRILGCPPGRSSGGLLRRTRRPGAGPPWPDRRQRGLVGVLGVAALGERGRGAMTDPAARRTARQKRTKRDMTGRLV